MTAAMGIFLGLLCFFMVLIYGVAFAVAVPIFARLRSAREKRTDGYLAIALSDPEFCWDRKTKRFQWQGLDFRYGRDIGSSQFSIFLEGVGTGGSFSVTRQKREERFLKKAGITCGVRTGDEKFDQQFYIDSYFPELVQECFASSERRETLKRLMSMKVDHALYRDRTLSVTWIEDSLGGAELLREAMEGLAVLARNFPEFHEAVRSEKIKGDAFNRTLMGAVAGVSAALGAASFFLSKELYPLFEPWVFFFSTLIFSLPALSVFLFWIYKTVKKTSGAHRYFLLVSVVALVGFPLSGYGVASLYNGMKDTTKSTPHRVLIMNKTCRNNQGSMAYTLTVASWRTGRAYEDIPIDPANYIRAVVGKDHVLITTKPGRLGFEWRVWFNLQHDSGEKQ